VEKTRAPRNSLSRERVVAGAVALVDAQGLEALTMRSLATELQAKPMSLYRHVAGKEELLDAMVERLYAGMDRPDPNAPDWRAELRRRSSSVRSTLVAHPWALGLLESRTGPSRPATFEHAESVLATLLTAGFSPLLASRAFVALDSFVYGFALQEVTMPSTDPHGDHASVLAPAMEQYPSMLATAVAVADDPEYDFGAEFDAGLDLVLDGIDRWRLGG
jgi:AcrR family transcriptional regulator